MIPRMIVVIRIHLESEMDLKDSLHPIQDYGLQLHVIQGYFEKYWW